MNKVLIQSSDVSGCIWCNVEYVIATQGKFWANHTSQASRTDREMCMFWDEMCASDIPVL